MKRFDLEKAKAGHPLVTRDGRKIRFIAHVPECETNHRVLVRCEGSTRCWSMSEGGESNHDEARDLFLAPKPKVKREGWVAVGDRFGSAMDMRACSSAYPSKDSCERVFPGRAIVHIEWEEESE